jgi:DNA repair exonuclease SbcCD nuclease subunit
MADHAPAAWKADYRAELLDCLRQIGGLASRQNVDFVLDGGDFFHVKAPTRNSHALMVQVADIHRQYPCPVYAIEGNHDLTYNNVDTVERQPLGVLFAAGIFTQLRDVNLRDAVRVVGMPYSPTRTLEDLQAIRKQPGDKVLIAVVHALATEKPDGTLDEFFGEPVFRYADLALPDGPDVWLFGHWHRDQGAVQVGGKWFVNPGSVSRGALVQENLSREPKVALIDVNEETCEVDVSFWGLNVMPAKDAFDIERRERLEAESDDIGDFVGKLKEAALEDDAASIEDHLAGLDFAKDVREAALEYLERARVV